MSVPPKSRRKVTTSSGDPRLAIDDRYATAWITNALEKSVAEDRPRRRRDAWRTPGLLGKQAPQTYAFESSLNGKVWTHICRTRNGEGGQDVFAFTPVAGAARTWTCETPQPERGWKVVELNLYAPALRYPGAKRARAGGRRCDIRGEVISAPNMNQLVIDF